MMRPISDLRGVHQGQPCYIVGMGPSLMKLTREYFKDGFIIATYESIYVLESFQLPNALYSMQKDNITGIPNRSPLIVHSPESALQLSPSQYEPCYLFDNATDFGRLWYLNSGVVSSYIAHLMGASHITILCFDRTTHEDRRRVFVTKDGQTSLDPTPDNFLSNVRSEVEQLAEQHNISCTWVTPQ